MRKFTGYQDVENPLKVLHHLFCSVLQGEYNRNGDRGVLKKTHIYPSHVLVKGRFYIVYSQAVS